MKIQSGILTISKTEADEIRTLIHHAKQDIAYGSAGSYGDGDLFYAKVARKAQKAIRALEWILERCTQ